MEKIFFSGFCFYFIKIITYAKIFNLILILLYNHSVRLRGEVFILNQDLMDWINADRTDEKISGGTGLLLVPMNSDTHEILDEKIETQKPAPEPSIEDFIINVPDDNNEIEFNNEISNLHEESEIKENPDELNPEAEIEEIKIEAEENSEIKSENPDDFSSKISELNQTLQEIQELFDSKSKPEEISSDNDNDNENNSQENETGFALNLNEPPPELWTKINAGDYELNDNNEDDDEELDYEQGMSLQGAAYVPKAPKDAPGRGQNFTERLHQTLRGRKQRAEKLREKEEEKKPRHPYRSRALIICSTLLMILGLAYLALWFIQQWTPEKIYERASEKLEIGDYESSMNLFQRGYKRYPNVLKFLSGLAKAAESADRVQTAIIALEGYIKALPDDDNENKNSARLELKRLKGEPDPEKILVSPKTPPEEKKEEIEKEPEPEIISEDKEPEEPEIQEDKPEIEVKEIEEEKKSEAEEIKTKKIKLPAAFYEVLNEANEAYNEKLYDKAIIFFHRAVELNGSDVRAYIGLAGAYKAKGMFFDSKRILDNARRRFKKNFTVETQLKILEGE